MTVAEMRMKFEISASDAKAISAKLHKLGKVVCSITSRWAWDYDFINEDYIKSELKKRGKNVSPRFVRSRVDVVIKSHTSCKHCGAAVHRLNKICADCYAKELGHECDHIHGLGLNSISIRFNI